MGLYRHFYAEKYDISLIDIWLFEIINFML